MKIKVEGLEFENLEKSKEIADLNHFVEQTVEQIIEQIIGKRQDTFIAAVKAAAANTTHIAKGTKKRRKTKHPTPSPTHHSRDPVQSIPGQSDQREGDGHDHAVETELFDVENAVTVEEIAKHYEDVDPGGN